MVDWIMYGKIQELKRNCLQMVAERKVKKKI